MKKVEPTEASILKAHKEANKSEKTLLENLYGKDLFNQKITDRIKTFEDACEFTNTDASQPKFSTGDKDDIAYQKLKVIAQALNEGWKPDWANKNEYKYTPYGVIDDAGVGFSITFYGNWNSDTRVGSRLCFKSSELAMYAGKQFEGLYIDFLL